MRPTYEGGRPTMNGRGRIFTVVVGLLLLCFVTGLEGTLLSSLPLPGLGSGSPWLALSFILATGFLSDEETGGLFGLLGGILADAAVGEGVMLRPLLWFLLGWYSGYLSRRILAQNLPSFMVFVLAAIVAETGADVAVMIAQSDTLPPFYYLWSTLFPDAVWTVLCGPLTYAAARLIFVRKKKRDIQTSTF